MSEVYISDKTWNTIKMMGEDGLCPKEIAAKEGDEITPQAVNLRLSRKAKELKLKSVYQLFYKIGKAEGANMVKDVNHG